MPSWYNHPDQENRNRASRTEGEFDEETLIEADREYKKTIVKYYKTTTDITRLDIAQKINSSVSTVDKMWKEIREEEKFKLEEKADQQIRKQIREYEFMKIELFKAWQESKKEFEKTRTEEGYTAKGDIMKTTKDLVPRLPKVDYFSEIRAINSEIAKLLGIVKLTEINFNQQNNEFNVTASDAPPLVPAEHNQFIKKPDQIPDHVSSIDDDDHVEDVKVLDE